jgi:DNA invertase Pin-like site-specific DNA recombinase
MLRKLASRQDMIVGYARTSTVDQLLSIDGQRDTLDRIARGFDCKVAKVFVEHESGGNNERVELDRAIKHARRVGATLVVAKLDRLARDQSFLLKLYDGNVPIIFGDIPEVDGRTAAGRAHIQMMALMAEFERRRMSERMKDWHRMRRAQGFKAGTPANLTQEARLKGIRKAAANQAARAIEDMSDITPIAAKMASDGRTLQDIADHLNEAEYPTRKGSSWSATQVARLLDRVGVRRTDRRRRRATPGDAV